MISSLICVCEMGSPPHTRGIRVIPLDLLIEFRFTPAYAGNTGHRQRMALFERVHPRIRGEY